MYRGRRGREESRHRKGDVGYEGRSGRESRGWFVPLCLILSPNSPIPVYPLSDGLPVSVLRVYVCCCAGCRSKRRPRRFSGRSRAYTPRYAPPHPFTPRSNALFPQSPSLQALPSPLLPPLPHIPLPLPSFSISHRVRPPAPPPPRSSVPRPPPSPSAPLPHTPPADPANPAAAG